METIASHRRLLLLPYEQLSGPVMLFRTPHEEDEADVIMFVLSNA
jgi:hypothetical protein